MIRIKSTTTHAEIVTFDGHQIEIPVVMIEFSDGRRKKYRSFPDGSAEVTDIYDSQE